MRIATGKTHHINHTHTHAQRVLHIIGSMGCGGIETWLLHLLRAADRSELAMDFLVHTPEPAFYDEEILDLGARIIFAGTHNTPIQLARRLSRVFQALGHYDVVHTHVGFYAGYSLALARYHNIPIRIAHSHNLHASTQQRPKLTRKIYNLVMANQIQLHATHGLAASPDAARALFGPNWQQDPRFQVLFCGLDFSPFEAPFDTTAIRAQFGFTPEHYLLTHVGSFTPEKNHDFLIDTLQKLTQKLPQVRLLLIGDGPAITTIRQKVTTLNLQNHIHFAGQRTDIPQFLNAANAFIFPSLAEGLGLALIEAQAAGLPCFISDTIPTAATVIPKLVHAMPLAAGPNHWASEIATHHQRPPPISRLTALKKIQNSPFDIHHSLQHLKQVYGLPQTSPIPHHH